MWQFTHYSFFLFFLSLLFSFRIHHLTKGIKRTALQQRPSAVHRLHPQSSQSRCQPCFLHFSKHAHTRCDIICTQIIRIGQQSAPSPPLSAKQILTQSVNLGSRSDVMFDLQLRYLHAKSVLSLLVDERDISHPLHSTPPSTACWEDIPPAGWRRHYSVQIQFSKKAELKPNTIDLPDCQSNTLMNNYHLEQGQSNPATDGWTSFLHCVCIQRNSV